MTDRAVFMARVRSALGRSSTAAPSQPPPAVEPSPARLVRADQPIVDIFVRNAQVVGMHVRRCSEAGLRQTLNDLLRELGVRRVSTNVPLMIDDEFERVAGDLDAMFDVDVGVTDVQAGIAESGTLVLHSDAQGGRCLSLVPPLHVAVLRASAIVPDQLDYWPASGTAPSSTVFITGPSKTADIEGELIQGVHGPREVYILLVEDSPTVTVAS